MIYFVIRSIISIVECVLTKESTTNYLCSSCDRLCLLFLSTRSFVHFFHSWFVWRFKKMFFSLHFEIDPKKDAFSSLIHLNGLRRTVRTLNPFYYEHKFMMFCVVFLIHWWALFRSWAQCLCHVFAVHKLICLFMCANVCVELCVACVCVWVCKLESLLNSCV